MFSDISSSPSAASPPGDAYPVAIVGGGFSGTVVASLLARSGLSVILVDGSAKVGRGTAYSTTEPAHLLNVPAERMSAFVDDSDDFLRAIADEGGGPNTFAPRRRYGEYLRAIFDQAIAGGLVKLVAANAVSATQDSGSWELVLDTGERLAASALVLATGNQPPAAVRGFDDFGPYFVANPWSADALAQIDTVARGGGDVLLIGTGLTMVDTVLSLEAAGFAGRITAVSRRGQLPQSHGDFEPARMAMADIPAGSLMSVWRWLRRRSAEIGWRSAIDSLRPHSQALWQSLPVADRRRFMRHARAWWDVRRHRLAPQVAKAVEILISANRLEIVAGKVESARTGESAIEVALRRRGQRAAEWRHFALVINCTGPLHAISRTTDPLLRSLFDGGLAKPDDLDIGLALGEGARVVGARNLWAVGTLTKGRYWEIIAVPDIREQAAAVAVGIVEDSKHVQTERNERA
ncbi:MAG: FAD/NAD(P)-binding protein [Sphingomicrobium sp.]